MEYPKLYKISTTAATLVWWMEQNGPQYRMHSGQLGGKIVTTTWTIAKSKNVGASNETTPEAQATAEINSAYALKKKKGYRDTVEQAVTSDRFQCMLADKYKDRHHKLFDADGHALKPLWVQPKLDGIRCIARADGLRSREGNPITAVPHIEEMLRPVFERRPELILDGELYNHELHDDFNSIVSLVKKTKSTPEDLELSRGMIQYWVYDAVTEDPAATFSQRFMVDVSDLSTPYGMGMVTFPGTTDAHFVMVPTFQAQTREEVDALYESFLTEGYEGAMIRTDAPYAQKRSQSLLKRKELMDAEFKILGFREGDGNASGMAKIADMEIVLEDGAVDSFKADICGTREECREYLRRRDEAVGKLATIEFQNYTPDGVPRFPKLKTAHFTPRW